MTTPRIATAPSHGSIRPKSITAPLATSTIALDGHGKVVETPGGWQDFLSQNTGFFKSVADGAAQPAPAPKSSPAPRVEPPKPSKLSYKDQRRLQELDAAIAALPGKIAKLEADLADPNLYARDPAAFAKLSAALESARQELSASEEEWLELEERREALAR